MQEKAIIQNFKKCNGDAAFSIWNITSGFKNIINAYSNAGFPATRQICTGKYTEWNYQTND